MFNSKDSVFKLTDKDFKDDKVKSSKFKNKYGYIMFYAPWCPHCQSKEHFWSYLGNQFNHNPEYKKINFRIGAVDVTDPKSKKISDRLGINAIPRFMHVFPDGSLESYKGSELSPEALLSSVCDLSNDQELCTFDTKQLY